jgi:hypothetical protein
MASLSNRRVGLLVNKVTIDPSGCCRTVTAALPVQLAVSVPNDISEESVTTLTTKICSTVTRALQPSVALDATSMVFLIRPSTRESISQTPVDQLAESILQATHSKHPSDDSLTITAKGHVWSIGVQVDAASQLLTVRHSSCRRWDPAIWLTIVICNLQVAPSSSPSFDAAPGITITTSAPSAPSTATGNSAGTVGSNTAADKKKNSKKRSSPSDTSGPQSKQAVLHVCWPLTTIVLTGPDPNEPKSKKPAAESSIVNAASSMITKQLKTLAPLLLQQTSDPDQDIWFLHPTTSGYFWPGFHLVTKIIHAKGVLLGGHGFIPDFRGVIKKRVTKCVSAVDAHGCHCSCYWVLKPKCMLQVHLHEEPFVEDGCQGGEADRNRAVPQAEGSKRVGAALRPTAQGRRQHPGLHGGGRQIWCGDIGDKHCTLPAEMRCSAGLSPGAVLAVNDVYSVR